MMDISDGLARSLHQLAEASGCGFSIEEPVIPIDETVKHVAATPEEVIELGVHFGEDFELVFTVPSSDFREVKRKVPIAVTKIGRVTKSGVTMDGEPLPDRGYTHN
jgi:thiamine-monophosphate kinase